MKHAQEYSEFSNVCKNNCYCIWAENGPEHAITVVFTNVRKFRVHIHIPSAIYNRENSIISSIAYPGSRAWRGGNEVYKPYA